MTGDQLRNTRKKLDMSREELATKLRCSIDAVASWEQGRRPIDTITKLAIQHLFCKGHRHA